jgi:predicted GNAT superfamily acetyltransferase
MDYEIREIKGREEIEELIELQAAVYGLPPRDTMSPITLTALTQEYCKTGWVLGAFQYRKMVAFCIALATAEPDLVYGHMLGVLADHRDSGLGNRLLMASFDLYRKSGMGRVCWTYEPLEARNAHLYLNRLGGRCVRYVEAHYHVDPGPYRGMPLDRFLIMLELNRTPDRGKDLPPLREALALYPVATADHRPDAPAVLVEIPSDFFAIKAENPAAALAWRMNTRAVLKDYVNQRGMAADALFTQAEGDARSCYYLLKRPGP